VRATFLVVHRSALFFFNGIHAKASSIFPEEMFVVRKGLGGILSPIPTTRRSSALFPELSCRHAAGGRRRIPRPLPSAAPSPPWPSLPPPAPPPPPCYSRQDLVWRRPSRLLSLSRRVRLRRWSSGTGKLTAPLLKRPRGACSNSASMNSPIEGAVVTGEEPRVTTVHCSVVLVSEL
jgi:hypothetical protein